MIDRDADLAVADDAEAEGRHDVATELRARHLPPEEQLVETYRVRLGLLPWAQHAEGARRHWTALAATQGHRYDGKRRTGRSTKAMLEAIARCEVNGYHLLAIAGTGLTLQWSEQLARELLGRLGITDIAVRVASDSQHLRGLRPHVAYRDHFDHEQASRRRAASADYEQALIAWCRYHVATEAFDRSISTVRDPRGDAVIDHDPSIRRRSSAFAREQRARMSLVTDHHTSQRAKEQVCSWSYETQRRFLEEHGIGVDTVEP